MFRSSFIASLILLCGTATIAEAQFWRRTTNTRPQQQQNQQDDRDDRDDDRDEGDDASDNRRTNRTSARSIAQPSRSNVSRPGAPARVVRNARTTPNAPVAVAPRQPNRQATRQTPAAPTQRATRGQSLSLTTNDSQQQIEVVIGPAQGVVKVVGINGGSEQNFSNVGALSLTTGANLDAITFTIRTATPPQIVVNTGFGDSDVKFVYAVGQGGTGAVTDVLVLGGPNNDKVLLEGVVLAPSLSALWTARLGDGDNEVVAKVEQPNAAAFTNAWVVAETGAGIDKLVFDVISAARGQDLRVSASLGDSNDSAMFKFDGQRAASTSTFLDMNMGAGQDQAEAVLISRGGQVSMTGGIRGGSGDDNVRVLIEGAGVVDASLEGDEGDDYLDMELKGNVRGATRHLGGFGNDFLKLVVVGPRRLTPFMDGGPGIDAAIGFGQIVNVEQVDRQ